MGRGPIHANETRQTQANVLPSRTHLRSLSDRCHHSSLGCVSVKVCLAPTTLSVQVDRVSTTYGQGSILGWMLNSMFPRVSQTTVGCPQLGSRSTPFRTPRGHVCLSLGLAVRMGVSLGAAVLDAFADSRVRLLLCLKELTWSHLLHSRTVSPGQVHL